MFPDSIFNRLCVVWWDGEDEEYEDWPGHLSRLTGWPVRVTTDNVEIWDGGGA